MALCSSRWIWYVMLSADPLRNGYPLKTGWYNKSKPKTVKGCNSVNVFRLQGQPWIWLTALVTWWQRQQCRITRVTSVKQETLKNCKRSLGNCILKYLKSYSKFLLLLKLTLMGDSVTWIGNCNTKLWRKYVLGVRLKNPTRHVKCMFNSRRAYKTYAQEWIQKHCWIRTREGRKLC